jgi:hypothetical protein
MTAHFCAVCNRLGDLCLDAGKSIAGRTLRAEFHCSEASSRDSLAVHLVNKAPKEHLDFREPSIWGKSANIGL